MGVMKFICWLVTYCGISGALAWAAYRQLNAPDSQFLFVLLIAAVWMTISGVMIAGMPNLDGQPSKLAQAWKEGMDDFNK